MIEAVAPTQQIRRTYNFASHFYGRLAAPLERGPRMRGLERARVAPRDKVLEVAVGPGATFLEILKRVDRRVTVYGIDLSPKMLAKTEQLVRAAGYSNFELREADARRLPFPDNSYDVLYSSFMLDLIPLSDMPLVLAEFQRVLKPDGRLVLVNFSKKDGNAHTWYERLYGGLPLSLVPYVLGGCRPVLMERLAREAGFREISREFIANVIPSEVVAAKKASA